MSQFFDKLKDKAGDAKDSLLDRLGLLKGDWPQTMTQPPFNVRGFLPPQLIRPTLDLKGKKDKEPIFRGLDEDSDGVERREPGDGYVFTDWMGYKITENPVYKSFQTMNTKERFGLKSDIPRDPKTLDQDPYSTRETYLMFNDSTQDYLRHSLQVVNGLNTDFPEYQPLKKGEGSTSRLYHFLNSNKGTPFENNDPVMFGFDLIIDAVSSPLFNGSVYDFLDQFSMFNNEIKSRYEVYEDFKNQFKKIFKTRGSVFHNDELTKMTNLGSNPATLEPSKGIYNPGRRAYMAYYLKKIAGLENLSEKNLPGSKKFLVDYGKDVITLDFYEDVSLTMGTLAHLYKLLYWSKANGKHLIPENVLRFNCDIVVSECRNFNRVRRAVENGNLQVIKENVSRYIYSLRECQFYFDKYSHPGEIDNSNIATTETYTISFDYKYSSMKLEKWTPDANNFGKYVGYHNGAIWKRGNVEPSGDDSIPVSVPRFLTVGGNSLFQNGVNRPVILNNNFKVLGKEDPIPVGTSNLEFESDSTLNIIGDKLKNFGKRSLKRGKDLAKQSANRLIKSAIREGQAFVNTQFALLNDSINKILNAQGFEGINPPRNIYTGETLDLRGRLFYDVRGEVMNFIGGMLGNQLAGQGSVQTIVVPPRPPGPKPLAQTANLQSQRSFSFTTVGGDTVRYDQTAQQNYGTSDFTKIQFPFYAQRYPPPLT